ncbi:hypothetical protein D3C79_676090 [compost metagenome]
MGAYPGGLALELALKAENGTQQRGHDQAHCHLGKLLGIGDVGKLRHQGNPDLMPPGVHGLCPCRRDYSVDNGGDGKCAVDR